MTRLKFLGFLFSLGAAVLVSACSDDDDAPPAPAAQTTSELADQEIADNTTEVIAPLQLNELDIRDDDTNETALPRPI